MQLLKKHPRRRCAAPSLRAIASAVVGLTGLAQAQQAADTLPEISVSATRSAREVNEVPASVTVKDRAELDEKLVESVRDLVRDEPGVSLRRAPSRFGLALSQTGRAGNEGFNIRGIEGNRVLILVDGLRLPNAFSFGANSFGRGDYLDPAQLSSVEILRGPASALYGSDGLAGAVSFFTPDPADLLRRSNADRHVGYRFGYDRADEGTSHTLSGAVRFGAAEAMLMVSRRDASELGNQGERDAPDATRTKPNPQEFATDALLSKFVYPVSPVNRLRFTVEAQRQEVFTNALSGVVAVPTASTSVIGLAADDSIRRARLSIDQRAGALDLALADELRWALFAQDAKNRQIAREDRFTAADRVRDTRYDERSVGGSLEIDKRVRGAWSQRLTYGMDISRTRYESLRDGLVPPFGETFPAKAFPDTDYTLTGLFVQDELLLADGRWIVTPALRYDAFKLDPQASALFPGTPAALSDSAVTPKLALQWLPSAGWNLYSYAARGFSAPTPDQVNNGFTNPIANYRTRGNPDLRPESSSTVEVGAKFARDRHRFAAAAFRGRYTDFIEQIQTAGNFTVTDPAVFQFVNLREVEIKGIEIAGRYAPARDWLLSASVAWAEGRDKLTDRPLNSINPLQLALGTAWQATPSLRPRVDLRYAGQKPEGEVDSSGLGVAQQFNPPAHWLLDLGLHWAAARNVAINVGVFNLTDRKYWQWTDVRGLPANSTVIDAYTQPGRTFAANVRIDL
jgi:hemoglobin/transferrin/lactoferrin receptor protein